MSRHLLLRAAVLTALLLTVVRAAPADDDLFSSKPGAKPTVPTKPVVTGGLPGEVTAQMLATGEGGIETWQLPGVREWLREMTYLQQRYVAATPAGALLFSADGRRWETVQLPMREAVRQVFHDGQRWVALTARTKPYLHVSVDGKQWTSKPAWALHNERLAVKDGHFWAAASILWNYGVFYSGEIDSATATKIPNWDGKITKADPPMAVLQSGGLLYLVKGEGELLASDNGEYWESLAPAGLITGVTDALLAEGNGRVVNILMNVSGKDRRLAIRAQEGAAGAWYVARDVPFMRARSLAYGRGRFVVIGTTVAGKFKDPVLYESADGLDWKRVAALDTDVTNVAYGPAGFVMGGSGGKLYVYHPAAWPEQPAFVRAPTPVPAIRVKEFGRNYTGKGKYRKETGPKTPDQFRAQELQNLLPKALSGDAAAKRELAMATLDNYHAQMNPWVARKWLQEAIAAGDPIAPRGYARLLDKWKPETPPATIAALYRQSAERGDVPAMVWLVENDLGPAVVPASERMKWAIEAAPRDAAFAKREQRRTEYTTNLARAEAGDAAACYLVAKLLVEGEGIKRDVPKAEAILCPAIAQKHPESMLLQAALLEEQAGTGNFASEEIAAEFRRLITAAADAGNRDALIRLVSYQAEGKRSFPKDEPRAYASHLKLAESGYVPSMSIVGRVLYVGTVVPKDEAAARRWLDKAAAANDRNAKQVLAEIEKLEARAAERPPLDAKVDGVTPEVMTALQTLQAAPGAALDEPALRTLLNGVWADADYSALDEDLAQELAAPGRPVGVISTDGRSVSFTKVVTPEQLGTFSQIFPVSFQPANLPYYFTLWQRTGNAGLLVGGSRVSPSSKSAIEGGLAKALYEAALKDAAKPSPDLVQYIAHIKTGHDAASPAVQQAYRELIRRALDTAKLATGRMGNSQLAPFINLPWLKEPVAAKP